MRKGLLNKEIVRIYSHGGVLSPGDLLDIVSIANKVGTTHIHFGIRQDILMIVDNLYLNTLDEIFAELKLKYELISEFSSNNIVSSYPAASILRTTSWLRTGHYYSIMDEFEKTPELKVNIVDPMQGLVPLLTGNLNFVASEKREYWYLFIKYPDSDKLELWPTYITTADITKITYSIVDQLLSGADSIKTIKPVIDNLYGTGMPKVQKRPEYPLVTLPNYDGIHQVDEEFWIGIYKRHNDFPITFIEDLCALCIENKIGKLGITPWHSLLVKGIKKEQVVKWDMLLNKYGINTQHSSLELNWQIPTLDEEAEKLKLFIYKEFDKNDIRTKGLTFGVRTRKIVPATNVIIERVPKSIFRKYRILHSKDFNPNNREYVLYTDQVYKQDLPGALMDLTRNYNNSIETQSRSIFQFDLVDEEEEIEIEEVKEISYVYECAECMSVYDPVYGDEIAGVQRGTRFEDLPDSYCCAVCDAQKASFTKREKHKDRVSV